MQQDSIKQLINTIETLPSQIKEDVMGTLKPSFFRKGSILLHTGQVANSIYFIEKGIIRAYKQRIGSFDMQTLWLAGEGEIACVTDSFFYQRPAGEVLETMEDCTVYPISYMQYTSWVNSHPPLALFALSLLTRAVVQLERQSELLRLPSVEDRIDLYLKGSLFPSYYRRVPDKYIASYLGTTAATFCNRLRLVLLKR